MKLDGQGEDEDRQLFAGDEIAVEFQAGSVLFGGDDGAVGAGQFGEAALEVADVVGGKEVVVGVVEAADAGGLGAEVVQQVVRAGDAGDEQDVDVLVQPQAVAVIEEVVGGRVVEVAEEDPLVG